MRRRRWNLFTSAALLAPSSGTWSACASGRHGIARLTQSRTDTRRRYPEVDDDVSVTYQIRARRVSYRHPAGSRNRRREPESSCVGSSRGRALSGRAAERTRVRPPLGQPNGARSRGYWQWERVVRHTAGTRRYAACCAGSVYRCSCRVCRQHTPTDGRVQPWCRCRADGSTFLPFPLTTQRS